MVCQIDVEKKGRSKLNMREEIPEVSIISSTKLVSVKSISSAVPVKVARSSSLGHVRRTWVESDALEDSLWYNYTTALIMWVIVRSYNTWSSVGEVRPSYPMTETEPPWPTQRTDRPLL
jgi:hypothetical protein